MKAHDLYGNEIDSKNLTDMQSLLLEKIASIDLKEVEKYKGIYFLWGAIPESEKIVIKQRLKTTEDWSLLLRSLNKIINEWSDGKISIAIVKNDE